MPAMDFKKLYKDLYLPPAKPMLIDVPAMNFLIVDGAGDPNGPEFQDAVGALYSMSYTLKMLPKKGVVPEGYADYTVPPLEGLWWLSNGGAFSFTARENWVWSAMIRQPEFVTKELVSGLLPEVKRKKPNPALERLRFEAFTEGPCVQVMHTGPFATEPETMKLIEAFIGENGLSDRIGLGGKHHEIYLSDPRRGSPAKMKTVLRHPVARA